MFEQCLNGFGLFPSQTKQYGNLDVAVRALNEFGSIILVASHDLADDDLGTAQQSCIACAQADHQAAVDAAEIDHGGGGNEIEDDLLGCSRKL